MLLYFDIDNVLADTDPVIRRIIYEYTKGRVNLSQEDVVEFNYCLCPDKNGHLLSRSEWIDVHSIFSTPEIIGSIELFPKVKDNLKHLSQQYKIKLATSRHPTTKTSTLSWLEKNQLEGYQVHFLEPGKKHKVLNSGALIVEDHYEQAVAFAQNGTRCFLFEYPWNVGKKPLRNLQWVKGWNELVNLLLGL